MRPDLDSPGLALKHRRGSRSSTLVKTGLVTLVGAGPGGLDLLTIGGARAIATADVVVYDRLVDPEIVDLASVGARRIPVGKAKGCGPRQGEINETLVTLALAGHRVVRLKGGDPWLFGRGAEEVDVLSHEGIEVRVIPGVSSALAAPGLAGVSLTRRDVSSGVVIVSGHRAAAQDYNWGALVKSQLTLVVLMAASTGDRVARQLMEAGQPQETRVLAVHAAGTSLQQSMSLRLGQLAETGTPFPSPTVLVIGAVVDH